MPSTRAYIPRVLLAFDFDRTLASDSIEAVLEIYGISREEWDREFNAPLGDGWAPIIRRGQALIELGRTRGRPLTREILREAANRVRPFDGVLEMPDRLTAIARKIVPQIEVEVVILSSGYAEIIAATEVARHFDHVFASGFHFGDDGRAICVKRVIDHPDKALYLDAIARGADLDSANSPAAAGRPKDEHQFHVPFDQMVFIGDGASDLQAFGLMNDTGGLAIAVAKGGAFGSADQQTSEQRVENLAPPSFAPGAELLLSLEHAVRATASRAALRKFGEGE